MAALATLGFGKTMEKSYTRWAFIGRRMLLEIGSKQAAIRLKEQYSNTCVVILYYLEAAIQGVEIKQLSKACKADLKAYFNKLN